MTKDATLASVDFTEDRPIAPTADSGSASQSMVFRVRARDTAPEPKGPTNEARLGEAERLMGAGHYKSAARIVQALALDVLEEGDNIRQSLSWAKASLVAICANAPTRTLRKHLGRHISYTCQSTQFASNRYRRRVRNG